MRSTLVLIGALALAACAPEGEPEGEEETFDRPEEVAVGRSPEETEPVEPRPSIEVTGAPIAALHERGVRDPDRARGAQMLEQACDQGFEPSCIALAERLEAADGIAADPDRAAQLLEEACMSGSTIACDRLGH